MFSFVHRESGDSRYPAGFHRQQSRSRINAPARSHVDSLLVNKGAVLSFSWLQVFCEKDIYIEATKLYFILRGTQITKKGRQTHRKQAAGLLHASHADHALWFIASFEAIRCFRAAFLQPRIMILPWWAPRGCSAWTSTGWRRTRRHWSSALCWCMRCAFARRRPTPHIFFVTEMIRMCPRCGVASVILVVWWIQHTPENTRRQAHRGRKHGRLPMIKITAWMLT